MTTHTKIWPTKEIKKIKWTEETEKVFNNIKQLLPNPPVLKAPTPDGLFRLESDTSRGIGGTLLQKQGDEWVIIGYNSKRLSASAKSFGVTELELTGLLDIITEIEWIHHRFEMPERFWNV